MRKKSAFSLLEMLIAISLLSILLSSLFFWYKKIAFEKKETAEVLIPILKERYADIKLSRILSKAQKEREPIFFTDDNSLVFIFDNGTNLDPLLSDAVLGCIYLDSKTQTLCLKISPHPKFNQENPTEHQVLLTDVKSLSFSFYYPPRDTKKIVDPKTVGDSIPLTNWQTTWKKGYQDIPTIVKIIVKRPLFFTKREPLEFTYLIEEQNREINFLQ